MRKFNYDLKWGEFVANPSGVESGTITGNRVFVSGEGSSAKFKIEINDGGNVMGALSRLIKSINPDFIFPEQKEEKIELTKLEKQRYIEANGNYCPYCGSKAIEGTGERNSDDNWTDSEIRCLNCECHWKDVYILTDIFEM